jgi:subtilisin family serine protease
MKKIILLVLLAASLGALADPGLICLRETVIDPSEASIQNVAEPVCVPTASGKSQYLIQPEKNFTTEETIQIKRLGITFIGCVPPNAYHVLASHEEIEALKKQTKLLYLGEFVPEYKTTVSSKTVMAGKKEAFNAYVLLSSDAEYDEVAKLLPDCKKVSVSPTILEAKVTRELVDRLSKMSAVVNVEEKSENFIFNDVAKTRDLMNVEDVNSSGYTGKGVTVCVADTGLDSGNPDDIHPDFTGKDITGVICSTNPRDDWQDLNGHGTHVAGSVCGMGRQNGQMAGMAPDANLYFICCGAAGTGIYTPTESDVKGAYDAGARIMSNSWGDSNDGSYNSDSLLWDGYAVKYSDMLIVFAAGNANRYIDTVNNATISHTASAKNLLTVGASENYRPTYNKTYGDLFSAAGVFKNDKVAYPSYGTQQGMAYFSSRGPTKDGRAKPDICAPGTVVSSTESIFDQTNNGIRKSYYVYMNGTSMATPLTSGACADILQYLHDQGIEAPSSAMIKAVLINGARTMGTGQYKDVVEIPDYTPNGVNGFGHVNLKESLDPEYGDLFVMEGTVTNTGDSVTFSFQKNYSGKFDATLCWTDPTGSIAASKNLVNDLDLIVSCGGETYYAGGATNHVDSINNVEKLHSEWLSSGAIEITIKGENIMKGPQTFAIAVSGVEEFIPEPSLFLAALIFALLLGRKTR